MLVNSSNKYSSQPFDSEAEIEKAGEDFAHLPIRLYDHIPVSIEQQIHK